MSSNRREQNTSQLTLWESIILMSKPGKGITGKMHANVIKIQKTINAAIHKMLHNVEFIPALQGVFTFLNQKTDKNPNQMVTSTYLQNYI